VSLPIPPRPDQPGARVGLEAPPTAAPGRFPAAVPWRWWYAIGLYLVANLLLAQVVVGGIVFLAMGAEISADGGADTPSLVAGAVANAVFLVLMALALRGRTRDWPRVIGLPPAGRMLREVAWGAGAGLLLYPVVALGAGVVFGVLLRALTGEPVEAPAQLSSGLSAGGKVLAAIVAIGFAPVVEELYFRGVLFRSVRDRAGFWPGALVSGVIFGLVHYVPAPWQDAVLLQSVMVISGLGFAWIYERRGTIVAPIAAHAVFNSIGIVLIFTTT